MHPHPCYPPAWTQDCATLQCWAAHCWTQSDPGAMGKLLPGLSRAQPFTLGMFQGLFVPADLTTLFLPAPAGVLLSFCIISSEEIAGVGPSLQLLSRRAALLHGSTLRTPLFLCLS